MRLANARATVSHNTNAISIFPIPTNCAVTASSSKTNATRNAPGARHRLSRSSITWPPRPHRPLRSPLAPSARSLYDKDSGAWGLSDFSPNEDSANRSALGFCGTYGPHCVIVASFSNICAAVATGGKNTVTWAKDPSRDVAQKDAVSNCAKKTKAICSLRRSNCYPP
jgi:Domain of unknown function (DUF4189)